MEFDVAELDLPEFSSAFSLALADPFESPLTVILRFVSAVMPVQSAPLTIMLPSLTVTVPWLAVAGGGGTVVSNLASFDGHLTVTGVNDGFCGRGGCGGVVPVFEAFWEPQALRPRVARLPVRALPHRYGSYGGCWRRSDSVVPCGGSLMYYPEELVFRWFMDPAERLPVTYPQRVLSFAVTPA